MERVFYMNSFTHIKKIVCFVKASIGNRTPNLTLTKGTLSYKGFSVICIGGSMCI